MRHLVFALAFLFGLTTAQAADVTVNYQTSTGPQQVNENNPLPQRAGQYGVGTSQNVAIAAPQYCQITSLASSTSLVTANCASGTILAGATIAEICVEVAAIRYTSSGVVTPTASVGIPVAASTCFQYSGPISTFKMIQQTSGAIVDIETFP